MLIAAARRTQLVPVLVAHDQAGQACGRLKRLGQVPDELEADQLPRLYLKVALRV